ncbi:MAG: hypothetical protein HPY44_20090 [Armatimonadetes bacterium]|nr:hypothetical protein [Armatimonadota bacterium]
MDTAQQEPPREPWADGIYRVLKEAGEPLHYVEIAKRVTGVEDLSSLGTPQNTVNYTINKEIRRSTNPRFVSIGGGVYGLTEWADGHGTFEQTCDILPLLQSRLQAQGFKFSDWQVACFYTALQTKGFVLLSGISGTGKTKLAQLFAEMLPQPRKELRASEDAIAVTVKPYMLKYQRVIIPKQSLRLFTPPAPGETRDVTVRFPGGEQDCGLTHVAYESTRYVQILFRGKAKAWVNSHFAEGDQLFLEPEVSDTGEITGFRLSDGDGSDAPSSPGAEVQEGSNHLFLPVRPDWRDSKNLLGYYNPLDNSYHWTEFLRFLVRARESHQKGDGLAWFVLLDEMNLAHVEYYFADLLSVMESGRDPDTGLTREALRLDCPEDAEGEIPPTDLHLPPNLYVIGTVNMDETTHAFSPKVLDRAFTIEFNHVDFSDYPGDYEGEAEDLPDNVRKNLLSRFTGDGAFAVIDKQRIAKTVAAHPAYAGWLQKLNEGLRDHDLHFGYRVFDEIHMFLSWAADNGVFDAHDGIAGAFDAAVLMKVLPKFNGSRARLEAPLRHVLAWCFNPDSPDDLSVTQAIQADEASRSGTLATLSALQFRLPHTARKAIRMLRSLQTDGFAAFG